MQVGRYLGLGCWYLTPTHYPNCRYLKCWHHTLPLNAGILGVGIIPLVPESGLSPPNKTVFVREGGLGGTTEGTGTAAPSERARSSTTNVPKLASLWPSSEPPPPARKFPLPPPPPFNPPKPTSVQNHPSFAPRLSPVPQELNPAGSPLASRGSANVNHETGFDSGLDSIWRTRPSDLDSVDTCGDYLTNLDNPTVPKSSMSIRGAGMRKDAPSLVEASMQEAAPQTNQNNRYNQTNQTNQNSSQSHPSSELQPFSPQSVARLLEENARLKVVR